MPATKIHPAHLLKPAIHARVWKLLKKCVSSDDARINVSSLFVYDHGGLAATDGHRLAMIGPAGAAPFHSDAWSADHVVGRILRDDIARVVAGLRPNDTIAVGDDGRGYVRLARQEGDAPTSDRELPLQPLAPVTPPPFHRILVQQHHAPVAEWCGNAAYLRDAMDLGLAISHGLTHRVWFSTTGEDGPIVVRAESAPEYSYRGIVVTMPVRA